MTGLVLWTLIYLSPAQAYWNPPQPQYIEIHNTCDEEQIFFLGKTPLLVLPPKQVTLFTLKRGKYIFCFRGTGKRRKPCPTTRYHHTLWFQTGRTLKLDCS